MQKKIKEINKGVSDTKKAQKIKTKQSDYTFCLNQFIKFGSFFIIT